MKCLQRMQTEITGIWRADSSFKPQTYTKTTFLKTVMMMRNRFVHIHTSDLLQMPQFNQSVHGQVR